MFKKFFALLLAFGLGFSSLSMATYTSTSPSYITKTTYDFNFKASYSNGQVQTSWNRFNLPSGYEWTYMKLSRSQTNSNPVYPEDGYVMYDGNIGVSSWSDSGPKEGKSYYRVCAITKRTSDGQKVRFCSNVVAVTVSNTNTYEEDTNEDNNTENDTNTDDKYAYLFPTVDKLVENYMKKLEAKYPGDYASQKSTLQSLINVVTPLATNSLFTYLKDKLEEQMQILNLASVLDL